MDKLELIGFELQFKLAKDFDGSLANMHTKSHSMYQGLLVSTSECNRHSFLDPISVPLSGVCLFVLRISSYAHLFDIPTTGLCS